MRRKMRTTLWKSHSLFKNEMWSESGWEKRVERGRRKGTKRRKEKRKENGREGRMRGGDGCMKKT